LAEETTNIESLTEQDLIEIFKFANFMYSNDIFGAFTPDTSNRNLVALNNNPLVPTKDKITKALYNYKYSKEELQGYAEFMEVFDMLYKRAEEYYANMLSFDLDISCTNAFTEEEYRSKDYEQDLKIVYKFLDKFDYIAEFKKIVKQLLRHEVDFVWFRDTMAEYEDNGTDKVSKTSKYTIQEMPQKFCKMTGRWDSGILYDFDMSYFTHSGVDVMGYAPFFAKKVQEIFDGGEINQKYIPTAGLDNRNGSFALWTQTSPKDGAWCFKFDNSNFAVVPFLTPMIYNLLTDKEIEDLQKDKDLISAKAILAGEIQLLDGQKSSVKQDSMAYNPKTLVKLMKLVKSGIDRNIIAVAMPTKDPKMWQFDDNNTDMAINQVKNTVSQIGSGSRLLYVTDKMSEIEAKNAIITDYNIVAKVYAQFNEFLNYFVNQKTRRYNFKFELSGCTYPFVREEMKKNYIDLIDKGIVLAPRTYAKVLDMRPTTFDRLLKEGHASDWVNKLTSVVQSVYTQSGKDNPTSDKGGRPEVSDSEISDSGATSRDY